MLLTAFCLFIVLVTVKTDAITKPCSPHCPVGWGASLQKIVSRKTRAAGWETFSGMPATRTTSHVGGWGLHGPSNHVRWRGASETGTRMGERGPPRPGTRTIISPTGWMWPPEPITRPIYPLAGRQAPTRHGLWGKPVPAPRNEMASGTPTRHIPPARGSGHIGTPVPAPAPRNKMASGTPTSPTRHIPPVRGSGHMGWPVPAPTPRRNVPSRMPKRNIPLLETPGPVLRKTTSTRNYPSVRTSELPGTPLPAPRKKVALETTRNIPPVRGCKHSGKPVPAPRWVDTPARKITEDPPVGDSEPLDTPTKTIPPIDVKIDMVTPEPKPDLPISERKVPKMPVTTFVTPITSRAETWKTSHTWTNEAKESKETWYWTIWRWITTIPPMLIVMIVAMVVGLTISKLVQILSPQMERQRLRKELAFQEAEARFR